MEIVLIVVALGVVGGGVVATILLKVPHGPADEVGAVAAGRELVEPPTINMSNLKVSGVGGFGLVLACLGIAIAIPAIGQRVMLALGLGMLLAVALVYLRRRSPLPSSGGRPGANTTLAIDDGGKSRSQRPTRGRRPGAAMVAPAPIA